MAATSIEIMFRLCYFMHAVHFSVRNFIIYVKLDFCTLCKAASYKDTNNFNGYQEKTAIWQHWQQRHLYQTSVYSNCSFILFSLVAINYAKFSAKCIYIRRKMYLWILERRCSSIELWYERLNSFGNCSNAKYTTIEF